MSHKTAGSVVSDRSRRFNRESFQSLRKQKSSTKQSLRHSSEPLDNESSMERPQLVGRLLSRGRLLVSGKLLRNHKGLGICVEIGFR